MAEEGGEGGSAIWPDYLLPVLNSFPAQRSEVKILVQTLGESSMSADLYDAGYHCITNFTSSLEFLRKMWTPDKPTRPTILWRKGDITNLKMDSKTFDVVIDDGVLDALRLSIQSHLEKVMRVLNVQGKFVSFMSCNAPTIKLFLQFFRLGWKISFTQVSLNNYATMVVTERVEQKLPFLISGHDFLQGVDADFYEAIRNENIRRMQDLNEMSLTLNDVGSGVVGDLSTIQIGRHFMMELVGKEVMEAGLNYSILVLDVDPRHDNYCWDIFFVSQATRKLLEPGESERTMICSHAQAPRVYVVLLDEFEQALPIKDLESDLKTVFQTLAPKTMHEGPVRYRNVEMTEDQLLTYLEEAKYFEKSETSSSPKTETPSDTTGGGGTDIPVSLPLVEGHLLMEDKCRFAIMKPCSVPCDHCKIELPEFRQFHVERCSQFHVEGSNIPNHHLLAVEDYEISLTNWLAVTKDRWSALYEQWNSESLRLQSKVDKVPEWNSSRPTEECSLVISGMIKAVCDYTSGGKAHGSLDNTDNYLMRYEEHKIGGLTQHVVYVRLLPQCVSEHVENSVSDDFMNLRDVIFGEILGGKKLPRLWADLDEMIASYASDLRDPVIPQRQLKVARRIITNHPSCWVWLRRYGYYEHLWVRINEGKFSNVKEKIKDAIRNSEWGQDAGWKQCIPVDTPFYRVLSNNQYLDDAYDLYRYLRVLSVHIYDTVRSTGLKCYLTEDIADDEYERNEFIEVVMTEVFGNFLLNIFKEMENRCLTI